jgi:hypothetical protein
MVKLIRKEFDEEESLDIAENQLPTEGRHPPSHQKVEYDQKVGTDKVSGFIHCRERCGFGVKQKLKS